jgi:solute carrier family 25 (mitochondrial phosphate transporter), member 23/24/25/41
MCAAYPLLPHHLQARAGLTDATITIIKTEGPMALYKGLMPTLLGIAPYAALNFALYDLAKKHFYEGGRPQGVIPNLLLGAATGTVAATVCYPLDTVRRRMQMKGKTYNGQIHAMTQIWAQVRTGPHVFVDICSSLFVAVESRRCAQARLQ